MDVCGSPWPDAVDSPGIAGLFVLSVGGILNDSFSCQPDQAERSGCTD